MAIKITKAISIPPDGCGRSRTPKFPFAEMEVGDSFFYPLAADPTQRSLRNGAYQHGMIHQRRYTVHREEDGLRCWRIK
jgi:hypothetical protein